MQVVTLGEQLNYPVVVCLGFFGCMHNGHVELLKRAKIRANKNNCKVALFTFSNNHLAVLKHDSSMVYTFDERLSVYNSLGVDCIITAEFDSEFKSLTGELFLSKFIGYNLKGVVCGFDHHCGSNKIDSYKIRRFFESICHVDIVDEVSINGEKVSTTLVRQYLQNGQIEQANRLLSEPFFALGAVVHGRGVGKTIGFPTANVAVSNEKLLPIGVFGGIIEFDGKQYKAIINIGNTPTFDIDRNAFEVHVIDYSGDLYGKLVKVSLTKYLRNIVKFNSVDELISQLNIDKENMLDD